MADFIGQVITTITTSKKDKNGYWTVRQNVIQKRTMDGETWDTREIEMSAIDRNLNKAVEMTLESILIYMDAIDGDLFNDETNLPVEQDKVYLQ